MTEQFDFKDGIQFDPGFISHLTAFVPSINYIYSDLNRFRNFSQKKMKFKMYYNKIVNLIDSYTGFYMGCILWAACIKDFDKPILNNLCFGLEYDEKDTIGEVNFVKEYIKQFEKDAKYYMGKDYKLDELNARILDEYEEFLKLNKGFVNVENANQLVINSGVKTLTDSDKNVILEKIAEVVESGDFKKLCELNDKLFVEKVSA